MLSPVRSRPPGDEEWSLLSSCIGDMEETDLLAFDEDLADASVWEENDMGTGPDGAMLPAQPAQCLNFDSIRITRCLQLGSVVTAA